jgi:hypothetical protein
MNYFVYYSSVFTYLSSIPTVGCKITGTRTNHNHVIQKKKPQTPLYNSGPD